MALKILGIQISISLISSSTVLGVSPYKFSLDSRFVDIRGLVQGEVEANLAERDIRFAVGAKINYLHSKRNLKNILISLCSSYIKKGLQKKKLSTICSISLTIVQA